jgi:hypothetical protein
MNKKKTARQRKLDSLLEQVEKSSYQKVYEIIKATFPLPNVRLIEDETEPFTDKVGFMPEQDVGFRMTLRDYVPDYYGDEEEYHEKLLKGEITVDEVAERVAVWYVSSVFKTTIHYHLKDSEAWWSSRLYYAIESGNWEA